MLPQRNEKKKLKMKEKKKKKNKLPEPCFLLAALPVPINPVCKAEERGRSVGKSLGLFRGQPSACGAGGFTGGSVRLAAALGGRHGQPGSQTRQQRNNSLPRLLLGEFWLRGKQAQLSSHLAATPGAVPAR